MTFLTKSFAHFQFLIIHFIYINQLSIAMTKFVMKASIYKIFYKNISFINLQESASKPQTSSTFKTILICETFLIVEK